MYIHKLYKVYITVNSYTIHPYISSSLHSNVQDKRLEDFYAQCVGSKSRPTLFHQVGRILYHGLLFVGQF
jgi:hypothetical protein